ncbi:hypothetical protein EFA59_02525 [Weissella hellenica]|nr:hypothetical protein EFA59_02525 [Weissella hellenica]
MEQDNQDLNDLVELEASFLPEEQTAAKEIAKILRDKNFSYKQKSKVLHFVDEALYTVLINYCDFDKKTSQANGDSEGCKKTFSIQNNLIKNQPAQK